VLLNKEADRTILH